MGFYGKVNNNNATQFVIDKIYSSRVEMEWALLEDEDNVFIGRYVLIEYNHALTQLFKTTVKIKEEDGTEKEEIRFYFSRLLNEGSRAKFLSDVKEEYYKKNYVKENQIIYILDENSQTEYYKCIGGDDNGYAIFEKQAENYSPAEENIYFDNYLKDALAYPDSRRGYDSTVWQKIYVDESEQYVMIAELNSVVPTFDLAIDAPSSNITKETAPHFDADSTNVYYKLHVQPNWGFRVKPDNGTYSTNGEAIYYNADGFKVNKRSHVNKADEISLKPTGISTYSKEVGYNSHDPKNPFATTKNVKDIQELSIILPSLGNAVSDMWDLIYGQNRKTNIQWNSTEGLRLTNKDSGYAYDTDSIETLAGCINTTHDLIGMLVKDDIDDIDKANTNSIYYGDLSGNGYNSYYIKNLCYRYTPLKDSELEEWIKKIEPIKLVEFSTGNYYTKTNEGYKKDTTKKYQEGTSYYDIIAKDITLDGGYKANTYYYRNADNLNVLLDKNSSPNENIQYYDVIFNAVTGKDNTYFYNPKPHIENADGTKNGLFHHNLNTDKITPLTGADTDLPYDPDAEYFYATGYSIGPGHDSEGNPDEQYKFPKDSKEILNLIPFEYDSTDKTGNYYYIKDKEYICLTSEAEIDDSIEYGTIKLIPKGTFYEPNLYYYKSGDDFIFATSKTMDTNKSYVVLNGHKEPLTHTFYQPNKYYYKDNLAVDRLDTNPVMTPNREYFIKYFAYVFEDTRGILEKGAEWNSNVKDIPEEVTLAKREEYWDWKELIGFGKDLNTIIGLIIRINNLIKFDDFDTRDNHTVQGCINVMNDIINTFTTLLPGELMIVDKYGRMASSSWVTDDWINLEVNNDPIDHLITLTHTGPVEKDARNENNKTPKFGDTFIIEDWVFDEKGHQTNLSTHTVKIPQGSLVDEDKTGSDIITQLEFTPKSGKLETTRENLSSIKLDGYVKNADNADVAPEDTLSQALSKLQTQIIEEETNRANIINALDMSNEDTAHFISKITQTDGQVAIERAAAGTLKIADENGSYSVPEASSKIDKQDTLAVAFGKVEAQINTANATRAQEVKTLTDNLNKEIKDREDAIAKEIKDRDAAILAETNARIESVNKEIQDRKDAIAKEVQDRDAAILVETNARIKAINDLDAVITAEASEIITSIAQTDGLVSAGKKKIGDIVLTGWSLGENIVDSAPIADTDNVFNAFAKTQRQINANKTALAVLNGNSTTQGSVAYQIAQIVNENNNGTVDTLNEIAAWIVNDTTGAAKMNSDIKANATNIALNTAAIELLETSTVSIATYEAKIAELEQEILTVNSRCNVLDKEVKNLINKVAELEAKLNS